MEAEASWRVVSRLDAAQGELHESIVKRKQALSADESDDDDSEEAGEGFIARSHEETKVEGNEPEASASC